MRVEFINPFVESAYSILKEYFAEAVKRKELSLKATSMSILGVAAMVGLAGDVEGRVLFDMSKETALNVSNTMAKSIGMTDTYTELNEESSSIIMELANQITAQAITKLHELGFKFDLTPPAIFTGDNMVVSTSLGNVEALVVPMDLGPIGKIEVNVVIRERIK